jgi:hypothetical protein
MKKQRRITIIKTGVVMIVSIVLATLGLSATDNIGNFSHSLLGSVFVGDKRNCPADMVFVSSEDGGFCIDRYEASPSLDCPSQDPKNQMESQFNLDQPECKPMVKKDNMPWKNISQNQAQLACAKTGKRLPTNKEWYRAALGTPDTRISGHEWSCNLGNMQASSPDLTGSKEQCISSSGAFDMIGNVWEWVDGTIYNGMHGNIHLVDSGHIAGVDSSGIPTVTSHDPQPYYHNDYFWINTERIVGMLRGGYYGNDERAGVYTLNATMPHSFVGIGVGFRCAK